MPSGGALAHSLGLQFGSYLGRQMVLGACREDPDDDFRARPFTPRLAPTAIPAAVDLRGWMTPVEDQGRLGSCTSNALASAMEYLVRRETGRHLDFSRLFIYFNQRLWYDCVRDDIGAAISHGIRVLCRLGVPPEEAWPYHPDLFAVQPPVEVYRTAWKYRALDYWKVPATPEAMRGCLAAGFPVTIGTRVFRSFMELPRDGAVPMPRPGEQQDSKHGRHALLLVGYHDASRVFIVRNSWGDDWGDRGYCYMPYDYILGTGWTRDCWALRLTSEVDFAAAEHVPADPSELPRAPAQRGAAAGVVGTVAGVGTGALVSGVTGSGLLGGLVGGLVQGIVPALSKLGQGRDGGAVVGPDRREEILEAMRSPRGSEIARERYGWDDGLDEHASRGPGSAPSAQLAGPKAAGPGEGSKEGAQPSQAAPPAKGGGGTSPSADPGAASPAGLDAPTTQPVSPDASVPDLESVVAAAGQAVPDTASDAPWLRGGAPPSGLDAGGAPFLRGVGPDADAPWLRGARDAAPAWLPEKRGAAPAWLPEAQKGTTGSATPDLPPAVAAAYQALGGAGGELGALTGAPVRMTEASWAGWAVLFGGGAIFDWEPTDGGPDASAFSLRRGDPLLERWIALGAGAAVVGWPVAPPEEHDAGARLLGCARGAIVSHPTHGVREVHGPICAMWMQEGALSTLGHPLTDVEATPDGALSCRFERGRVCWSPQRGAWVER